MVFCEAAYLVEVCIEEWTFIFKRGLVYERRTHRALDWVQGLPTMNDRGVRWTVR